jgi:hypothetical protein
MKQIISQPQTKHLQNVLPGNHLYFQIGVPPGNGRENLRKLDGEISGRALPIGSRPWILLVNEREARCVMEGELGQSERARELMQCIL